MSATALPLPNRFDAFRSEWNQSAKKRLLLGGLLAGGAIVATSTGVPAIAGIMLATRAALGAIGGFLATEAALELVQEKTGGSKDSETFQTVKTVSACTVGAVLGILGGSSAAEALTQAVEPHGLANGGASSSELNTKAILADIRHDHPKQWYVTLEQAVRRAEWLKLNIGLHESEKLIPLNESVSKMVHDPHGKIAESMRQLGYLGKWSDIEHVARTLKESDIEAILKKTYSAISETHVHAVSTPHATIASSSSPLPYAWGAVLGAGALAGAGYLAYANLRKRKETSPIPSVVPPLAGTPQTAPIPPETPSETPASSMKTLSRQTREPEEIIDSEPEAAPSPRVLITPENARAKEQEILADITGVFSEIYGWTAIPERNRIEENRSVYCFEGITLAGSYDIFIETKSDGTFKITMLWYDRSTPKHHETSESIELSKLSDAADRREKIEEIVDRVYFRILEKRDIIKQKELRWLRVFGFQRSHLQKIYDRLDDIRIRTGNNEVLGLWTSDCYRYQEAEGKLVMKVLTNPEIDLLNLTPISSQVKPGQPNSQFYFRNPNNYIDHVFPKKEAELILRKRHQWVNETTSREAERLYFSGAGNAYNWHKHPGSPLWPSGGDIELAMKNFWFYQGLEVVTFGIAVRISDKDVATSRDPKCLIFDRKTYGGEWNYAMRFYKVLKPENERERPTSEQIDFEIEEDETRETP